MKKSHAAVLWGLIGSVCVAGNFDYIWNASAPSSFFGDGKVGIDLDGSMISGMSVNTISGDTVSFSTYCVY